MRNSLSTRLTYRIMAVVLVMMAVITSVVYFSVKKYMLNEATERYLSILLKNQQEMRRRLSDVYVAVENNVHDIERDIDNPDLMFGHVERIVRLNNGIITSALLFEQNHYPEKDRVFIPCAREDINDSVRVSRIDSTYQSYFYGEWFQQQLQKDEGCWTKPYLESEFFAGNQEPRLLVTYTAPIHNHERRPVALLCADISLDRLRNKMMEDIKEVNDRYEKDKRHKSYFFVIDQDGTYIAHPDKTRMMTTIEQDVDEMMSSHEGSCVTEIDGVKSWLSYRPIKFVNWVIVIVTPEDVILSNARILNIIILLTMIAGLLAIYLLCHKQIKEITNPVAAEKAAFEKELRIANAIQMAMLPSSTNLSSSPAFDLHAKLTPARDVGGDLYDFFLRDNRLFFCIGDVSGKGVPAALMMMVVRAMFRGETRRADRAADIVVTMNHNLSEENTAGYFVTMFVGILDLQTGMLDYCNAGHEAPLLLSEPSEEKGEGCTALPIKPNLPVGTLSDWNYEGQQAQLQPGDMLFLYTDGLSEAKNTAGEQLGREHVLELACKHNSDTAQQLIEAMDTEVHHHATGALQSDDITMLALRWQPTLHPSPLTLNPSPFTLNSTMDDIALLKPFIEKVAEEAGMEDKEAKRLRLAVEEAVANVINYSQATSVTLQASQDDDHVFLTIDDDGQPFDPTVESPTDLSIPADQRPPGGMGIILLHQMTDGLTYQRLNNHNILKIKKLKK